MSCRTAMLIPLLLLAIGCGDDKPAAPADIAPFSNDLLSVHQGYMPILGVPPAWAHGRGDVIVAVLDNGVELNHPDLRDQLWTNPGSSTSRTARSMPRCRPSSGWSYRMPPRVPKMQACCSSHPPTTMDGTIRRALNRVRVACRNVSDSRAPHDR
jgi:hypothetical protein